MSRGAGRFFAAKKSTHPLISTSWMRFGAPTFVGHTFVEVTLQIGCRG